MEENKELVEALAEYAHCAWSGWMEYMFRKCADFAFPSQALVLPEAFVVRWKRQARTPYGNLPEEEKESDRDEAREMLAILRQVK